MAYTLRDILIVQLRVESAGLREFDDGINRPCEIPIDESNRQSVVRHDVPGSDVAMADDSCRAAEGAAEPGTPCGVWWWGSVAVATCNSRGNRPTAAAPSSVHGPGS